MPPRSSCKAVSEVRRSASGSQGWTPRRFVVSSTRRSVVPGAVGEVHEGLVRPGSLRDSKNPDVRLRDRLTSPSFEGRGESDYHASAAEPSIRTRKGRSQEKGSSDSGDRVESQGRRQGGSPEEGRTSKGIRDKESRSRKEGRRAGEGRRGEQSRTRKGRCKERSREARCADENRCAEKGCRIGAGQCVNQG